MNTKTRAILEHMLEDALDAIKFAKEVESAYKLSSDRL